VHAAIALVLGMLLSRTNAASLPRLLQSVGAGSPLTVAKKILETGSLAVIDGPRYIHWSREPVRSGLFVTYLVVSRIGFYRWHRDCARRPPRL
jgi:hypothetical protein